MVKQAGISEDAVENLALIRERDATTIVLGEPFHGYVRSQPFDGPPFLDNYVLAAGDRHFLLGQLDDCLGMLGRLRDFVARIDPAILDAFIFGENIRAQKLARGEKVE